MVYKRKTRDVWHIYVNYGHGHGWEHEITELSSEAMRVQRRAYRENCSYPIQVRKVRERLD